MKRGVSCFFDKKGEMYEIVRIVIFVLVLVVLAGGVIYLLKGGGGEILASLKNIFRFGR